MSRKEFYEMRPGEFLEALSAHNDEMIADRRHIGELVRGATLRLFNLQVTQKSRVRDPRKFWPMPWDETQSENDEIRRLESLDEDAAKKEADKFFSRLNGSK